MNRVILPSFFAIIALFLAGIGCGGYTPPSNGAAAPTSGVKNRVLITNQVGTSQIGSLLIVDATADVLAGTIGAGTQPQLMAFSAAGKVTLIYDAADNGIRFLDNTLETVAGPVVLSSFTESVVITPDGKTAYAALPSLGQVAVIDVANKAFAKASPIVMIPGARRLVMANNGSKVLVFSNNSANFSVINTSDNTVLPVGPLDSPFSAVFSSDDSKAFILNCGPECGGTTAGVTLLNIGAGNAYTVGSTTPVPGGATVGALDGANLYVAGSPVGSGQSMGKISALNLNTLALGNSAPISDGLHTTMAVASNGKVYVGARTCTSIPAAAANPAGCLSAYSVSANTSALSGPLGEVTSILPIKSRTVVYVIEGGELVIYDTSADKPQATQIDIVGKAVDARQIDQ